MSQRFELAALLLFLSGTAILMVGCAGGSAMKPPSPLSVSLSKSAATIDVGTTLQLSATVANDSTHAGVAWTLSGPGSLSNQTSTSATYTGPGSTGSATVTATAVADKSKSASSTVTVVALPVVTPPAQIPPVTVGQPYSLQLAVTGGTPPFTWSVAQGQLPKGLSLDSSTGLISGTAQSAALASGTLAVNSASATTTVSATVQATDSSTPSQASTLSLNFDVNGNASVLGFVYVEGDLGISEFSIGSDGALTLLRPQPGARSPALRGKLIVDPLHRFVYGLDFSDILQYKIAADGTLTEMTPLTVSLGNAVITATDIVMAPGGSFVYVSSSAGIHSFSVGSDGQLHQLGSPVPGSATSIATNGAFVLICAGESFIDSYKVNLDGTLSFFATSGLLSDPAGVLGLGFQDTSAASTLVIASAGDHLATYAITGGVVNPKAVSIGPIDSNAQIFDLSVLDGVAYAVGGDNIVPPPPGGSAFNDHVSIYAISNGKVGTPEKINTGIGPGHVLALGASVQTGPSIGGPLLYVTNSNDNNIAQCGPPATPGNCLTVTIAPNKNPTGITGFLGSPGQ